MPSSQNLEINNIISDEESLFRGVLEINWNKKENRISSSAFKDSNGCSVDRCHFRSDQESSLALFERKNFYAIAKVKVAKVRAIPCLTLYLPIEMNKYHSEIHDEEGRASIRSSKASKLSKNAEIISLANLNIK